MGLEVILHTLYELFPPSDMLPEQTAPLTGEQFVLKVLVPEVSVELIMHDLSQTRSKALLTKAISADYGVTMFPEAENEVVDEILMRRIKANARYRVDEDDLVSPPSTSQPRKRRVLKKRPRPSVEPGHVNGEGMGTTSKKICA